MEKPQSEILGCSVSWLNNYVFVLNFNLIFLFAIIRRPSKNCFINICIVFLADEKQVPLMRNYFLMRIFVKHDHNL